MTKRFTVAEYERVPGFLLEGTPSLEEVVAFVRAGGAILPLPCFLYPDIAGDQWFVTPTRCTPELPDKAAEDTVERCVTATEVLEHRPYKRFNRCSQLIKVVGCKHCDMRGDACDKDGGVPWDSRATAAARLDVDAVRRAAARKGGLVIGGWTYVPPAHTRIDGDFSSELRRCSEHDFTRIEENIARNKEKSEAAAYTRKLHKEDCGRCLYGCTSRAGNKYPGCDSRSRWCKGPYATEEAQVEAICAEWDPKVEEFLRDGEYTRGQFWAVARGASTEAQLNRQRVTLSGWRYNDQVKGFAPQAWRVRTSCHAVKLDVSNYGELRHVFPELPVKTANVEAPSPLVRALWYLSLDAATIPVKYGWGSNRREITYRQIYGDSVEIKTTAPSYPSYGSQRLTAMYLGSLVLGKLPPVTLEKFKP